MSKEHAYAYEAGYRDGSIHYELDHCPACKNVADLQEALDENTKLREMFIEAVMKLFAMSERHICDKIDFQKELNEAYALADELEAENAKLRDENARLLSCLTDDAENARQILGESRALQDENAKLRKLVKDMVLNIGGCALHGNPLRLREFGSRAKELGVEVNR